MKDCFSIFRPATALQVFALVFGLFSLTMSVSPKETDSGEQTADGWSPEVSVAVRG